MESFLSPPETSPVVALGIDPGVDTFSPPSPAPSTTPQFSLDDFCGSINNATASTIETPDIQSMEVQGSSIPLGRTLSSDPEHPRALPSQSLSSSYCPPFINQWIPVLLCETEALLSPIAPQLQTNVAHEEQIHASQEPECQDVAEITSFLDTAMVLPLEDSSKSPRWQTPDPPR